jgi:hypothetical protein
LGLLICAKVKKKIGLWTVKGKQRKADKNDVDAGLYRFEGQKPAVATALC